MGVDAFPGLRFACPGLFSKRPSRTNGPISPGAGSRFLTRDPAPAPSHQRAAGPPFTSFPRPYSAWGQFGAWLAALKRQANQHCASGASPWGPLESTNSVHALPRERAPAQIRPLKNWVKLSTGRGTGRSLPAAWRKPGLRERKVRTPQGSVPDNVRDAGFKARGRPVPQKTYRP